MRRYRLPIVPAFETPGSLGSTPKKQAGLGGTVSPSSCWLAPHLIIEHIEAQHSQHGSQAFGLETKRGKGRGPVTFDVKMLLKNLETELQHTTFDGTCLTFYTMMLGWDFKPMNVQLPETLKKVIQEYLISWMFHNTVCGDETRSIRPCLLICGGYFYVRIPQWKHRLNLGSQGCCFTASNCQGVGSVLLHQGRLVLQQGENRTGDRCHAWMKPADVLFKSPKSNSK